MRSRCYECGGHGCAICEPTEEQRIEQAAPVVAIPSLPAHYCGPNQYGSWLDHDWDAPGTVRRCKCGRYWIAEEHPTRNNTRGVNVMTTFWRPARWRERRRLRRHAEQVDPVLNLASCKPSGGIPPPTPNPVTESRGW